MVVAPWEDKPDVLFVEHRDVEAYLDRVAEAKKLQFPPVDPQDFICCIELAAAAAGQTFAPPTPLPDYPFRAEDLPALRKATAIEKHCGANSDKCRTVLARLFALERLVPILMQEGCIKEAGGELFVQEAVLHAAATHRMVGSGRFEANFLSIVRELNDTVHQYSFRMMQKVSERVIPRAAELNRWQD